MLEKIKNIRWAYIAFAVLFIGAGLCFVISPEKSVKYTGLAIGLFVAVIAVLKFVLLLPERERGFSFFFRAVFFACAAICGLFFAFSPYRTVPFLASALGLVMIIDGAFKLQSASASARYRSVLWWLAAVLSVAAIAGGFVSVRGLLESNAVLCIVILGITLIIDGVNNFIALFVSGGIKREDDEDLVSDENL